MELRCRWKVLRGFISPWSITLSNHTVKLYVRVSISLPIMLISSLHFLPKELGELSVGPSLPFCNVRNLPQCLKLFFTGLSTADVPSILLSLTFFTAKGNLYRWELSPSRFRKPLTPKITLLPPSCGVLCDEVDLDCTHFYPCTANVAIDSVYHLCLLYLSFVNVVFPCGAACEPYPHHNHHQIKLILHFVKYIWGFHQLLASSVWLFPGENMVKELDNVVNTISLPWIIFVHLGPFPSSVDYLHCWE